MTIDVAFFVIHDVKTEQVRCTRQGALKLLTAAVVLLEDEAHSYREIIKGREVLEAIVASGRPSAVRTLHVAVDSTTDDPLRMVAAMRVLAEKNPTGLPPWTLPVDGDGDEGGSIA